MKQPVVPAATAAWFGVGQTATLAVPGDLILVHHYKSFFGSCIRFGERLRGNKDWAWANHSALVVRSATCSSSPVVVEETARGAVLTKLSDWHGVCYCVVHTDATPYLRREAVAFANWAVGTPYSWIGIVGQVIDMATGLHLSVGTTGRMICSGLACRSLERLGVIPDKDPSMVTPADLARYFKISMPDRYMLDEMAREAK